MIRHIVAWNFKDEYTAEEKERYSEEIKTKLEQLPSCIKEIVTIEVITNLKTSSTHDLMLNSLFQSEADLNAYQVHPDHKKVSAFVRSVIKERICLDYNE